jgi:CRISPR-associated endonuclease Csn1
LEEFVDGILENTRRSKSHRFYEISKKIELLNKEEFTEEEKVRAQQRMLHATQYASSFFRQVLETYFKDSKVIPVTGKLVNEVRSLSGLGSLKRRGESDKHHAVDAAICAVCDYKIVKRMADYLRLRERTFRRNPNARIDFETNLIVPDEKVFEPYPGFRKDVEEKFEKILVSRMPRRKATGAGHRETILSLKHVLKNGVEVPEKGRVSLSSDGPRPTKRVRLDSLTESQIKEILKKPSPILVDEKSNWKLYEIIRKRLREVEPLVKDKKKWAEIAFGGEDGKIYMPTKDGGIGPEVKKIKIYTNDLSGIRVRGGIAENATLVRLDIYRKFSKKGKYQYFGSPVYAADIAMGYIPDKVADPNKPESEWPKIDNSFEFLCHVFRGDYLLIQKDESEKPMIICYRRFDRVNCRLIGDLPDRSNRMNGGRDIRISITNCFKIIKLHVDILGRAFFVEKEKKVY